MHAYRNILILVFLVLTVSTLKAQYSVTLCQTQDDALIATDRNDWAHNNLPVVNEGYLHNFEQPDPPCGIDNLTLVSAEITIDLIDYTSTASCGNTLLFGNVLLNCPLTTNSVCTIVQDVLSVGCAFGLGQTNPGSYSLDLSDCSIFPSSTDIIGVDIVPATETSASCPDSDNAISNGTFDLTYEICITYNYFQDEPLACENTITLPCDDGNDCTTNDQMIVDECDNTIICSACQGTSQADCTDTVTLPCDDGNPCTFNDEVVVASCDENFVCEPCEGELVVDCDNTITLPCDDGDDCTINDVQVVAACDEDFICEPCAGVQVESCAITLELPCDDNDPCTENDIEIVDACNTDIICVPCQGELFGDCSDTLILPCDDGDACTENDVQEVSVCDNSFVCVPCQGALVVDCNSTINLPCDDGDPCTENDVETVSACDNSFVCIPCAGEPVSECSNLLEIPCNDGNICTEDDVEYVDACNTSEVCIPCAGVPILPEFCDDQDCSNGIEFWDNVSCSCQVNPTISGCTDSGACNFDSLANCNSDCDYSCLDCLGVIDGNASIDSCGVCLLPDDPLRNLSCLDQLFIPNSFTPDNDGLNDVFRLTSAREFDFFEIRIFNRLGQEVFYSNSSNFAWKGEMNSGNHYVVSDVYSYVVSYSYAFPFVERLYGSVTVVR